MSLKSSMTGSVILRIIIPTAIAILLFIISIFYIIIPTSRQHILDRKREMIRELTNSAWNILDSYHQKELQNELSRLEAQDKAISIIETLRYGSENKDYFWITDMQPRMIVHPYRQDLNGKDLNDFTDSHGKRLFVECVKVVNDSGAGFTDYWWQWKDDSSRIVPKLSFVRGFESWDWIVGTGIYVEDAHEEISRITRKMIYLSIIIIFIISLILLYIARQSLKSETKKQRAERKLAESREKYKTLVEASTEGTLMILDNRIIFANQTLLNMLGYSEDELFNMKLDDLILPENEDDVIDYEALISHQNSTQLESQLLGKNSKRLDSLISLSKIEIYGKNGYILIAKDLSLQKKIQAELGESRQKFETLTDNINIGVFRLEVAKHFRFIETNPACQSILGMGDDDDISQLSLSDFLTFKNDADIFIEKLLKQGAVKGRVLKLKRLDGNQSVVSISAILIKGDDNHDKYIDGVIEDISELKKTEQAREEIISELQTSLIYLNQPVKNFARECPHIPVNMTVKDAAREMKNASSKVALVQDDSGNTAGIVTAYDLWEHVLVREKNQDSLVSEIMSAPIITISENALMFESLLLMKERGVRHLPLSDNNGKISGIITNNEIIEIQQYSASILVQEINTAKSVDELIDCSRNLLQLVKYFVESGISAPNITRIIGAVNDAVANKFIQFAIQRLGPPPIKFAFLVLGSQGREEQTLITDQDNAIVYENSDLDAKDYFLKLGEMVNAWLNDAGYRYCEGDIMAKNPRWCVDIDQWKEHFSFWINEAAPQDLLNVSIFFDFRLLFGERSLVEELKQHIAEISADKSGFYNHLTKNSLLNKPPINFIGNIVVKSSGERHDTFDIKHAIIPIIDFARIYSIRHNINATNTSRRLKKLCDQNVIKRATHDEIIECYNYLMKIRLRNQIEDMKENKEINNDINPKRLTQVEQYMLKKIFSLINGFQKKLGFDFTGEAY
jgi:PAS domain S-box-containing protein